MDSDVACIYLLLQTAMAVRPLWICYRVAMVCYDKKQVLLMSLCVPCFPCCLFVFSHDHFGLHTGCLVPVSSYNNIQFMASHHIKSLTNQIPSSTDINTHYPMGWAFSVTLDSISSAQSTPTAINPPNSMSACWSSDNCLCHCSTLSSH